MAYDKNMKVLIVDDFSTMRRVLKNVLHQLEFKNIIEADNGATAVDIMKNDKPDLIICDWSVPKMTGIELLRYVRRTDRLRDTPFLMVTAEARQESIIEAIKARVSQCVVKPFTVDTLGEKIEQIFG